jgi:hypothetical protein
MWGQAELLINSQEMPLLTLTDAPALSCIKRATGNQFPPSCQNDSPGGTFQTNIKGNFPARGTFSAMTQFIGHITSQIFPQSNASAPQLMY